MSHAVTGDAVWNPSPARPLEIAQVVWLHALDAQHHDSSAALLEIVQLAGSDPSVLRHALALGRARQPSPAVDAQTCGACRSLERAIALLGGRDRPSPIGSSPSVDARGPTS